MINFVAPKTDSTDIYETIDGNNQPVNSVIAAVFSMLVHCHSAGRRSAFLKTPASILLTLGMVMAALIAGQATGRNVRGPLRVHPSNPRYFTDGTENPDGSLKPVYLTGSHHWDNLQEGYNPEVDPFDYERYLNLLQTHRHNFFHLWAWEHVAAERSWHYDHKEQRFEPMPYLRTGPGLALDGRPNPRSSRV